MADKIKIAYIIASSDMGGAENFVYTFLNYLDSSKFEKYVVCPDGGYYTEKFKSLAKETLLISPNRSFMNPAVIFRAASFIRKNRIALIHTMLYTSDFCGIAAKLFSGRARVINTINGFNFLTIENEKTGLRRRLGSFFYRFIYVFSDKLVAVSDAVKFDLINRSGIKINSDKISTVLAAGISPSYDNFLVRDVDELRARHVKAGELVIAAIGALLKIKDYDTMLEAFRIVLKKRPHIRLLIAGGGSERGMLEDKVSTLGIAHKVTFLGVIDEIKKNALLSLADIYVLSSRSEGCPTALLEAMYFAKPVVATAAGGIPEIIENGQTGLLVPPANPQQLAEAVLDLLNNEGKRNRFSKMAKEVFEKRFSHNPMIGAYENIYKNIRGEMKGSE